VVSGLQKRWHVRDRLGQWVATRVAMLVSLKAMKAE
jgi:hypothetical protein